MVCLSHMEYDLITNPYTVFFCYTYYSCVGIYDKNYLSELFFVRTLQVMLHHIPGYQNLEDPPLLFAHLSVNILNL